MKADVRGFGPGLDRPWPRRIFLHRLRGFGASVVGSQTIAPRRTLPFVAAKLMPERCAAASKTWLRKLGVTRRRGSFDFR